MDFLSKWAGWVIGFFAAAFAIRGSIKFDVNQWQNDRRKRLKEKIRVLCPHAQIVEHDGGYGVKMALISPPGTIMYQCQRCGLVVRDIDMLVHRAKALAENPKEWAALEKKVERLADKL